MDGARAYGKPVAAVRYEEPDEISEQLELLLTSIWGGVAGARMHELLHGADIASPKRARSSISHQHVLAPEERSIEGAAPILRQLLVRAAQRLRDDGFYCRRLVVDVKWLGRERGSWTEKCSFAETQDTGMLLHVLQDLWEQVPNRKPLRVGVALAELAAQEAHQPDLFDKPRNTRLVRAIDAVNEKFGKGALIYGNAVPSHTSKIAFQRVGTRRAGIGGTSIVLARLALIIVFAASGAAAWIFFGKEWSWVALALMIAWFGVQWLVVRVRARRDAS